MEAASGEASYGALMPVVNLLVDAGNTAIDGGFLNSPGGWYCRMAASIDFELLRSQLQLPSSIELFVAGDTVLDRSTWSAVIGPLGDAY
jgi:hypothetical protein